jgi:exodeoxyribonuclease III
MKIATFNVNGITARLPRLLEWLAETSPDIACLQELKTSDETFPVAALRDLGYSAVWHGQKSWNGVAVLAKGDEVVERRRGLPGDPDDTHSRYIEASAHGIVVASIYLPNGNPQPGPKFVYKLAWFERLAAHAASLVASEQTVVLAGDYNVVASDEICDIYSLRSYLNDAFAAPETRGLLPLGRGGTDLSPSPGCADLPTGTMRPLPARRRPAHRPPATQRPRGGAPGRSRRRQERSRARQAERPRAGVDRSELGRRGMRAGKASAHEQGSVATKAGSRAGS